MAGRGPHYRRKVYQFPSVRSEDRLFDAGQTRVDPGYSVAFWRRRRGKVLDRLELSTGEYSSSQSWYTLEQGSMLKIGPLRQSEHRLAFQVERSGE
jgi:hypothetical protein